VDQAATVGKEIAAGIENWRTRMSLVSAAPGC